MGKLLCSLVHDSSGATAAEYALMLALIAMVIISTVALLGVNVATLFEDLSLSAALGGS